MFFEDIQDENTERKTDEEILALSIRHPVHFETIVDRYQEAFIRKAMSIIKSEEDAQDIVQDTFVKIYRYADKFEIQEGATFSSWAYKILVNTAITSYQKKKKTNARTIPLSDDLKAVLADPKGGALVEEKVLRDDIEDMLARIPETLGNVLRKHFIEGVTQKEIAKEEGISVNAVKGRVHRAKKAVKDLNFSII